ncbi:protein arginine N-methyltransferase 5 [Ciona intestinalis]
MPVIESNTLTGFEITEDLPDPETLKQWLGEPVRVVILNTSIFLTNKKGFPVLSRAHQHLIMQLFRLNSQFVITGITKDGLALKTYQQYLEHLYQHRPCPDQYDMFAKGYEDYLQSPLQPLMDNLESATYEVFEKDPVKYRCYEEAIFRCLADKATVCLEKDPIVLMVLGAGRGPLVRAALSAAKRAETKIKCFAVEKNANACVTLNLLKRTEWVDEDVTIVSGDMRVWEAPVLADIIVSELLGSFGDNELSPECLDGAARFLKPDCISIPASYTSYLAPISSQKLYNEVEAAGALDPDKPKITAFETPYVVRIHNYHELSPSKPVFTFTHPAEAAENESDKTHLKNSRQAELRFSMPCDTMVHGFSGYFHCTLYKDVYISIVPETHSPGMFSWFPLFFPVFKPVLLKQGDEIAITIWRQCTNSKVWYEWVVSEPCNSAILNPGGRSYTIGL